MTDQEELARLLTSVFSRHGAVPMSSAVVGFRDADTPANAAAFLDRSGAVLALRHEMRAPFAAWLARQVRFWGSRPPCVKNLAAQPTSKQSLQLLQTRGSKLSAIGGHVKKNDQ